MDSLTRSLAQILISKKGGNVDHNTKSAILELIDNSLDANSTHIELNIKEESNTKFLEMNDDGEGIHNIKNLFTASNGKIGKLGCKNQGFLDTLAYFSDIKGETQIITCYKGEFSSIIIDFEPLNREYKEQLQNKNSINYNDCQQKLDANYSFYNNKRTIEYLQKYSDIRDKLNNDGTYIKIQLTDEFDTSLIKDINPEYFQYAYIKNFNLTFNGKSIDINNTNNICLPSKYKGIEFSLDSYEHASGTKYFKYSNNVTTEIKYAQEIKNLKDINEETFNKNADNDCCEKKIKNNADIKINVTVISSTDAEQQKQIFNERNISAHRGLWINVKDKVIGPFTLPKTAYNNLLNLRMIMEINDNDILNTIIMSNKSKSNINNLPKSVLKIFEVYKDILKINYSSTIGKTFKSLKDDNKYTPGIPDLPEYMINLDREKEDAIKQQDQEQEPEQEQDQEQEPEQEPELDQEKEQDQEQEPELDQEQEQDPEQEPELDQEQEQEPEKKRKYFPWPKAVYFGFKGCDRYNGIYADNDNFVLCHFGVTEDDPKHRDSGSGLGTDWRRYISMSVNEFGTQPTCGKQTIEWKLYECVNNLRETKYTQKIKWESNSKEYFKCHKDIYREIFRKIREIMTEYEGDYF